MARKLYSVKYEKVAEFIKNNKSEIKSLLVSNHFEYAKLFGNTYYELRIKEFIEQYKIDKDKAYAMEVISFFKSSTYIEKLFSHIGMFASEKNPKELFYVLVYVLENSKIEEAKEVLFYHSFLFYIFTLNKSSNIALDHKQMSLSLLKTSYPNISIKESFGEKEETAYFSLHLNTGMEIKEQGQSIKTLRKKVYKRLFFAIIDNEIRL